MLGRFRKKQKADERSIAPLQPHGLLTRRRFVAGAGLSALGMGFYANQIARHELEVTHFTLKIRDLPNAFDGFRVVQISDLHLETYTEEYFLRRVVRQVNTIAPDLVLVTGDFVTSGSHSRDKSLYAAARCGEILHALACPMRFGCIGNHDFEVGEQDVIDRVQPSGVNILVNQYVPIERAGERFWLAGMNDPAKGMADLQLAVPKWAKEPVLMMGHEPDNAIKVVQQTPDRRVDVVFSGHSHGGQVRPPNGKPITLPPGAETYYEGLYGLGRTQLYVNRGIGTVGLPLRLNCPPEITIHTLRTA